ncbi:MAG: hypothetical protein ACXWKC_12780 [Xanthobacteraceae bacterium]
MHNDQLGQAKMGAEFLALCIASALIERDPSLQERIEAQAQKMYHFLHDRGDIEAAMMVGTFARGLFDPNIKQKR